MSSSSSSSRQSSPVPLTTEDKLDRMMKEVTPELDNNENDQPTGSGQQTLSPSRGTDTSVNGAEGKGISPLSGPMRSNEQRAARRLADRLGLHPYQKDALVELVKSTSVGQNVLLYSQQCIIENKLDKIIASAPVYKVTPALKANIDSVIVAILLSLKLSTYKGSIPKDRALICTIHGPTANIYVANVIEATIGESLTQTRASIKKLIKNGIIKKTRIYDLAKKLVQDTRCSVTIPLCGKIAILRTVYTESSGVDFWDKVDICLEMIRSKAEGDPVKVARAIKGYLKKDKTIYGGGVHPNAVPKELNPWQQGVDDSLIEAAAAAAVATSPED